MSELANVSNNYLLLGQVPESLALLVFGAGLIVSAIGMRWFFDGRMGEKPEEKQQLRAERR